MSLRLVTQKLKTQSLADMERALVSSVRTAIGNDLAAILKWEEKNPECNPDETSNA